jgi:predicted dehydrogenase
MARAAEDAGVWLTVCFPMRYSRAVQEAGRLIRAGALGELLGALVTYRTDKPASYWIGGFSGRSASSWRTSRDQAGGGVLIMNLSHFIDLVRILSGSEVETVSALTGVEHAGSEVEDSVSIAARHRGGAVVTYVGSSAVRGTKETSLDLWGTKGRVVIQPRGRVFTLSAVDGITPGRWHELGSASAVGGRALFMSRFGTTVHRGQTPDVTPDDGLAVQAFIEAAYLSAEEQRAVSPKGLMTEVAVAP